MATVAVGEPVDAANAPHPSNDAERLVFRQLYETLLRVDCAGRVQAGLASSWRAEPGTRTWEVMLREDARFTDGTPVTATGVVAGWTSGAAGLRAPLGRWIESVVPLDDRRLAVTPRHAGGDGLRVLADPRLAVVRRPPGAAWPLGTRGVRVLPGQDRPGAAGRQTLVLAGGGDVPDRNETTSLRLLVAPGRDLRDFVDEGVDLLVTRDPAALQYAATLPQYLSVPLDWHRTHVFVSRRRDSARPPLTADARSALAEDAIRGEARGAEGPFWWTAVPECEIPEAGTRGDLPPTTGQVVFAEGDGAARDLAERVVGLARVRSPGAALILDALLPGPAGQLFQRAVGLTGQALAVAQARGADSGYVVPIDRRPLVPCAELQTLAQRFAWLDPAAVVPLVDTRLWIVARRGIAGARVEWDGVLLVTGAGGGR